MATSKKKDATEEGMEEGRQRAEAENEANQVQDADRAPADASEAPEEEENLPTEVFEVKINPKLGVHTPEQLEIDGKLFFSDASRNRSEGTRLLNDLEYDSISDNKEPESGFQYIVKK